MPNLPKPPKLYYYLAGLAVFILVSGSFGFYFYQRHSTTATSTNTTQTPQNSSTSNPEPTKTSNEANIKPKEENLTSTSFESDPNTDVIVFKECGISLKLKNDSDLRFYITRTNGKANLSMYAVTPPRLLHSLSCGLDKSEEAENIGNFLETPAWLKKLSENYKLKLTGFTGTKTWSNDFQYNNLNYSLTSSYDDIFTSAKFSLDIPKDLKQVTVIDLEELVKTKPPTLEDYNKNPQIISDVNLIGCGVIDNFEKCFIADQDYRPVIDFSDKISLDYTPQIYKGKKTSVNIFIISEATLDWGNKQFDIYDVNFKTGFTKLKTQISTLNTDATESIVLQNEDYVDTKCAADKSGTETKTCFKNSSDYEEYILRHNTDISQNKAAQAELAKYLE